jgi:hypothetical protein
VIVRDCGGEMLVRRLWELTPEAAFILSEAEYGRRISGQPSLGEVGFPIGDCFHYSNEKNRFIKIQRD